MECNGRNRCDTDISSTKVITQVRKGVAGQIEHGAFVVAKDKLLGKGKAVFDEIRREEEREEVRDVI